jgi:molecular chaperone GrpE
MFKMNDDKSGNEIENNDKQIQTDEQNPELSAQEIKPITDIKQAPEYQELNDKYLRLAAEFDNYKKRQVREYSRLVESAESSLMLDILEVVDDFSRALKHEPDDQANFKQGIEMIANKFAELLKRRGLKEIEAVGKPFDPGYHEAIMQIESADVDEGVIIEEIQKGYLFNDKVLRPSRVVVAKSKDSSE